MTLTNAPSDRARPDTRQISLAWVDTLDLTVNVLARLSLILMVALISVQVFTRYVLNDPLQGVIGITEQFLMPLMVFCSLSYVEMHDGHIRAGILYDAYPPRVRKVAHAAICLVCAVFFALVVYATASEAWVSYSQGYETSGDISVPLVWALVVPPVGCFLLVLRLIVNALRGPKPTVDPANQQPV